MTALETRAIFDGTLELRQDGHRRTLRGRFPYNSTAVIADRGRVRKEMFAPRAFRFATQDPEREIHLLRGHNFDQPLASKRAGTLTIEDTDDALSFVAQLPDVDVQPTYMRDALAMVTAGLIGGISPGYRVPPATVVPDAERLVPEPGNPSVQIRVIREAVLSEISVVTRPAYNSTDVAVRAEDFGLDLRSGRRRVRWL